MLFLFKRRHCLEIVEKLQDTFEGSFYLLCNRDAFFGGKYYVLELPKRYEKQDLSQNVAYSFNTLISFSKMLFVLARQMFIKPPCCLLLTLRLSPSHSWCVSRCIMHSSKFVAKKTKFAALFFVCAPWGAYRKAFVFCLTSNYRVFFCATFA